MPLESKKGKYFEKGKELSQEINGAQLYQSKLLTFTHDAFEKKQQPREGVEPSTTGPVLCHWANEATGVFEFRQNKSSLAFQLLEVKQRNTQNYAFSALF